MRAFGLIGPLAAWELRRLARRGLVLRVWFLFLYVLSLAFLIFAALWFYPRPVQDVFSSLAGLASAEADAFAGRFTLVLLEAQLVAVVAVTPAVAASAVSEEKDRHTLSLLLTTQLTDREIVFGKAAGRIAFMLAVITSGFPILLLTRYFGKVDVSFLLWGYALTLGTVMLCAAIGLNAACRAPDFRSALLRAYGRVAALVCGPLVCGVFAVPLVVVSPFGALAALHGAARDAWLVSFGCCYPLAQLFVSVLLLLGAAWALRLRDASAGPPTASAYPLPPRPASPPLLQPERKPSSPPLPPLDPVNPVLWKERCASWRPSWVMPSVAKVLAIVVAVAAVTLFAAGAWIELDRVKRMLESPTDELVKQPGGQDPGVVLLMAAGMFAVGRYILPLAVGLSGAIAGERYRRTLDSLLSTPIDRRTILRAKVQAHAERGTAFAAFAVAAVGMAFTAEGDIRLGASSAGLVLATLGLILGLGAWLTARCPNDVRAFWLLLPFTLVAAVWPVGLWQLLQFEPPLPRELLTQGVLVAAGASALAGLVFWWLAERRMVRGD